VELNYRSPRIDPPSDPWDESFAGCFHPVDALLEPGANLQLDESDHGTATYRLIPELRQAVARFYERELGLRYPTESVLIVGGTFLLHRKDAHAFFTR